MKRLALFAFIAAFALFCVTACGGQGGSTAPAKKDFDGSGYSDTGPGAMYIQTAGGSSEGGNVPKTACSKTTTAMQITVGYEGGDGSVCTIYVDGMENVKKNASSKFAGTITLQGSALDEGVHDVEMVSMEGDNVKIYKKAQYEIVK